MDQHDAVPTPARGRRGSLDRDLVVTSAIDYMDRHGVSALTMRKLGRELDVEAMSLYRYVNGREDLLESVVARLVDDMGLPDDDDLGPAGGWQAYLQAMAHSVRRMALRHPVIFPLVATRHPAAPWLRPPLRSLRVVEHFLAALISRGFTDRQAVAAYRSFSSFLLGHLLLETSLRGAELAPVEEPLDEGGSALPGGDASLRATDYPNVARLRPLMEDDRTEDEFVRGLEALLDRIDLALAQ